MHITCAKPPGQSISTAWRWGCAPSDRRGWGCPSVSLPRPHAVIPKTAQFGGCSPTTSDVGHVTQGPGVLHHRLPAVGGCAACSGIGPLVGFVFPFVCHRQRTVDRGTAP